MRSKTKNIKLIRVLSFVLYAFALLDLSSCEGWVTCIEGNGDEVTENRAISSFTSISHSGDFDIEVYYSENSSLAVTADGNLLEYIRTYVRDGELIIEIDQDRCINSRTPIQIVITTPYIDNVILSGNGDIEVYDFVVDNFNMKISKTGRADIEAYQLVVNRNLDVTLDGIGHIYLDGKAKDTWYTLSGEGNIRGEAMRTTNCTVSLSGDGDVHTYVYETLSVYISGSGNVYYYGNPVTISQRITGNGNLIER